MGLKVHNLWRSTVKNLGIVYFYRDCAEGQQLNFNFIDNLFHDVTSIYFFNF